LRRVLDSRAIFSAARYQLAAGPLGRTTGSAESARGGP